MTTTYDRLRYLGTFPDDEGDELPDVEGCLEGLPTWAFPLGAGAYLVRSFVLAWRLHDRRRTLGSRLRYALTLTRDGAWVIGSTAKWRRVRP